MTRAEIIEKIVYLTNELTAYRNEHCTILSSNFYTDELNEQIYELKDLLKTIKD